MNDYTGNSQTDPAISMANGEPRTSPLSLSDRVRSLRLPEKRVARPAGHKGLIWFLILVCFCLTGGFAYLGYLYHGAVSALAEAASDTSAPAKGAGTSPGSEQVADSGDVVLERKGYVIPAHQILVSPKVSGMIEELNIEEGLRVKKGQVLAVLEKTEYQADYARARATASNAWQKFLELYTGNRRQEIEQAKTELEEMEANKKQLYLEWQRNSRLQSGSALAAREYEQAESQYKAMDRRTERMKLAYQLMLEGARPERIEAAWAEVEQAEADVTKTKWRLDNCTIRAPISGTILTKKAEIGNLVNPIAFSGSTSLCEMADLSELEIEMEIEERDIARVFKGQKCKVRPDAFTDKLYDGYVSRLMPTANRAKSAVPVRVKVTVDKDEEGIYLKPEMGTQVTFLRRQ